MNYVCKILFIFTGGVIACKKTGYVLNPRTQTCSGFYPHDGRSWVAAKTHCEGMSEYLQTLLVPTLEDAEWLYYQIQRMCSINLSCLFCLEIPNNQ